MDIQLKQIEAILMQVFPKPWQEAIRANQNIKKRNFQLFYFRNL